MDEAIKSGAIVKQLKPKRLEVCHGSAVFNPAEQLEEYVRKTEKKYRGEIIMLAVYYVVLGVFFLMELCALAAFSYWGFHMNRGWLINSLLGLGTPLLSSNVLGDFHRSKSFYSCVSSIKNYTAIYYICFSGSSTIFFR